MSGGGMGSGGGKFLDLRTIRQRIDIYCHPFPLSSKDVLTDGKPSTEVTPLKFEPGSILVWVDLQPEARFAHPTAYVFFSKGNTSVVNGSWRPVLNGEAILYGESEPFSIIRP